MRKTANNQPEAEVVVYDGRDFVGAISRKGERYLALDSDGRRLGLFVNRQQAYDAILGNRRSPDEERDG